MSTHSTLLWLEIRERDGGNATIDVADDIGVDECVRISVGEGPSTDTPEREAEIHLNLHHARDVADAIYAAIANHEARGSDPTRAACTVEETRHYHSTPHRGCIVR